MKIILISLQNDLHTLGLKYLHYYLLKNGYDSSILYLPNFNSSDQGHLDGIKKFILTMNPGFIGISLMSIEYEGTQSLTKYLKSFTDSIPIIWGGIHPTISPEECLNYADYVCVGEGEETILKIAQAISKNENIRHINNLCYLENGRMVRNPLYPLIENLDAVSSYELIPKNSYILANKHIARLDEKLFRKYDRYFGRTYSIATSRGCPFSCTYCCNNFFSQLYKPYKIRRRSVDNIISELKAGIKKNPKIDSVFFQDDCLLTGDSEYLENFFTVYKKEINIPFLLLSIPIYVNRSRMELLKNAGLSFISLGLQSGSDRVCRDIYKRKSLKADFLKAAKIINELKIAASYDIILDNPFENEADEIETIKTLMETPKPFYVDFHSLTFYCGTELYERIKRELPNHAEDYRKKDFFISNRTTMNKLIRISAFTAPRFVNYMIRLYKGNPDSLKFKIFLLLFNSMNIFIFEPVAYFKIIKLSQRGSYLKTFKVFSIYFKRGITRYINQFRGKEGI